VITGEQDTLPLSDDRSSKVKRNPAEDDYWRTRQALPRAMTGAQKSGEIRPRMITGEQDALFLTAITGAQKSAEIRPSVISGQQDTLFLAQISIVS